MVEQYAKVLVPSPELVERLGQTKFEILERCSRRLEYKTWLDTQKKIQQEQEEADKRA